MMIDYAWVHIKSLRNLSPRHVSASVKEKLKNRYCALFQVISFRLRLLRLQLRYLGIKLDNFKALALTNCRYRVRVIGLHLEHLRTRFHQICLYNKLVRLYLLDKSLCLSVLRMLDQFTEQRRDLRYGLKSCHNLADSSPKYRP